MFFFFAIAELKNFSWCDVIQQIKKPSPYNVKIVRRFFKLALESQRILEQVKVTLHNNLKWKQKQH